MVQPWKIWREAWSFRTTSTYLEDAATVADQPRWQDLDGNSACLAVEIVTERTVLRNSINREPWCLLQITRLQGVPCPEMKCYLISGLAWVHGSASSRLVTAPKEPPMTLCCRQCVCAPHALSQLGRRHMFQSSKNFVRAAHRGSPVLAYAADSLPWYAT